VGGQERQRERDTKRDAERDIQGWVSARIAEVGEWSDGVIEGDSLLQEQREGARRRREMRKGEESRLSHSRIFLALSLTHPFPIYRYIHIMNTS
jgi:hypothetical protein